MTCLTIFSIFVLAVHAIVTKAHPIQEEGNKSTISYYDFRYQVHDKNDDSKDIEESKDCDKEPNYEFKYAVNDPKTGDIKDHWEQRHGDKVKGSYSLIEPDGTLREVHYTSDTHAGFNAFVTKSGKAVDPVPSVEVQEVEKDTM